VSDLHLHFMLIIGFFGISVMSSTAPTMPVDRAFQAGIRAEEKLERFVSAYELSKRMLDMLGALSAVVVFFPILIGLAVAIRATTTGPILFRQRRLGRDGVEFWCYKFRTMVVNAEQLLESNQQLRDRFHETYKLKDDPRTTPIGVWLRKTSLDELPQLFNILTGAMSLIGPRPIVPPERAKYHEFADKLLSVKPGLGGYWQVYGRSDTTYEQRVQMDMTYIDQRSLCLDLRLLILTIVVALKRQGAY
jgi:lipopolysaccharide/colanic/teichoic acid biosynthesis glycosyltransferase